MSAYDPRPGCPRCGEKENLREDIDFDPSVIRYERILTCERCGWTGEESDLLTDAEARLEGKLHRMDL